MSTVVVGRRVRALLLALGIAALVLGLLAPPASAAPARINGQGSSYVALALQQWVADAQTAGLQVNYLPTGSPGGLTAYGQSLTDFSATEAEFSALQASGGETTRGFQYVPDVAGATAVLYHVDDRAGRRVNYLHLSRRTIARIFTGDITRWNDQAITDDNKGLILPDQPITVVYRGGQSGTTGTFYDFVAHVAPDIFGPWAARNSLPTNVRIIQLDSTPGFAPKTQAFNGSDQIAQFVASDAGRWSISYDEFGYAKTYHADAAWVQNASGEYVLPYAENISAALEGATLRPDLSQELAGVYDSTNPKAYPISAYSYLVTQCAGAGDRPTCKGEYPNAGISETLATWLRYIACEGQVNMARIGYSPLPPHLSQEVANSIGRLRGTAAEQLNAGNCANPRFRGSLGEGASSPPDPLDKVQRIGGGATGNNGGGGGGAGGTSGGAGSNGGGGGAATAGAGNGATGAAAPGAAKKAAGATGPAAATGATGAATTGDAATDTATATGPEGTAVASAGATDAGGGDGSQELSAGAPSLGRLAEPLAYDRGAGPPSTPLPLVLALGAVAVPAVVFGTRRKRHRA